MCKYNEDFNVPWYCNVLIARSEGDSSLKTSPISQHVNKMTQCKHTHPVSDVQEALLACEIEHQQEPHGVPEERRCQAAEPGTHMK